MQGQICQFRNHKPEKKAKELLEVVYCDFVGPIDSVARDGFNYTPSFVDDCTGINVMHFLNKREIPWKQQRSIIW